MPGAEPIVVAAEDVCLGNETTVQAYLWHVLLVLREIKRTLKETGVCWLVLGDSFSSGDRVGHGTRIGYKQQTNRGMNGTADPLRAPQPDGLPQGSLLGIPAQVMLAASADGWVVRNDVVWAKASSMPESVRGWAWQQARCVCVHHVRGQEPYRNGGMPTRPQSDHNPANPKEFAPATANPTCTHCGGSGVLDKEVLRKGSWRHTRSHETVLMLTKGMQYFANGEAVREPHKPESLQRYRYGAHNTPDPLAIPGSLHARRQAGIGNTTRMADFINPGGRNPRSVFHDAPSTAGELASLILWLVLNRPEVLEAYQADPRQPGSVVMATSANLDLPHYASFPPDLLIPFIQATCPERVCPQCGQGWAPVIQQDLRTSSERSVTAKYRQPEFAGTRGDTSSRLGQQYQDQLNTHPRIVHDLRPTCTHYCICDAPDASTCLVCGKLPLSDWHPGIVLDPFAGSGTTGLVARALRRRAVLLDLSYHYLQDIAQERLGLAALAAWEGRGKPPAEETHSDLPLFAL